MTIQQKFKILIIVPSLLSNAKVMLTAGYNNDTFQPPFLSHPLPSY